MLSSTIAKLHLRVLRGDRLRGRGVLEADRDDRVEPVGDELAQAGGGGVLALVRGRRQLAGVVLDQAELADRALEARCGGVVERLVAPAADVVGDPDLETRRVRLGERRGRAGRAARGGRGGVARALRPTGRRAPAGRGCAGVAGTARHHQGAGQHRCRQREASSCPHVTRLPLRPTRRSGPADDGNVAETTDNHRLGAGAVTESSAGRPAFAGSPVCGTHRPAPRVVPGASPGETAGVAVARIGRVVAAVLLAVLPLLIGGSPARRCHRVPGRGGAAPACSRRGDRARRRHARAPALAAAAGRRGRAGRVRGRRRARRPRAARRRDRRGLRARRPGHRRGARRPRPARAPAPGVDAQGPHRDGGDRPPRPGRAGRGRPRGPLDRRQPGRDRPRWHVHRAAAAHGPAAQLGQRHGRRRWPGRWAATPRPSPR